MRLFIAFDFGEQKEYFNELQKQFLDLGSYSMPKSFHLTFKFLGEVTDSKTEEIKTLLGKVKFSRFKLSLSSFGVFPNPDYVRVLWIGLEPKEQVMLLQKQIDSKLANLFPLDKRFHPHVTLARVKNIKDKKAFCDMLKKSVEPKTIELHSFELIKSVLTPAGPIYETIATFPAES